MKHGWQELTKLTQGADLTVERVRVDSTRIAIEGEFELPPLAKQKLHDQIFIMAFVKSHGSIKEMERIFGVSYPTIKSRLNRLGDTFDLVHVSTEPADRTVHAGAAGPNVDHQPKPQPKPPPNRDVLDQLSKGEITARQAVELLKQ